MTKNKTPQLFVPDNTTDFSNCGETGETGECDVYVIRIDTIEYDTNHNYKYYIGCTGVKGGDLETRLQYHAHKGSGSEFTRIYSDSNLYLLERVKNIPKSLVLDVENAKTGEYLSRYSPEQVTGGSFCGDTGWDKTSLA